MLIIANETQPRHPKSNARTHTEEGECQSPVGAVQTSPTSVSHEQQRQNLRYIDKLISKHKQTEMEQSIKIEDYYRKTNTRLNVSFNRHVSPPNVDDLSFDDLKIRVLTPTNPASKGIVQKKRKLEVLIRDVDSGSKDETSSNERMTTLENGAVASSSASDPLMNPLTHLTQDSITKLNFIQVSQDSLNCDDSLKEQLSRNHPKQGSRQTTVFTRSKNDKARQSIWAKYDPHLHLTGNSCLRDSMMLN